jgi:hypothetical protein
MTNKELELMHLMQGKGATIGEMRLSLGRTIQTTELSALKTLGLIQQVSRKESGIVWALTEKGRKVI